MKINKIKLNYYKKKWCSVKKLKGRLVCLCRAAIYKEMSQLTEDLVLAFNY